MKSFRFVVALFLVAFVALGSSAVRAQHEHEESTRPNYFENDNAPAMYEWLYNYLNPSHDPDYWQKRLVAQGQFDRMRNVAALKANPMAAWQPAGYSQNDVNSTGNQGEVSGRVLSFDIASDGTMYLSSASGGLWKSVDRGQNWVSISDGKITTMCISSIAVDPKNPNVIYAGTGEQWAGLSVFNSGNSSIGGVGIFKTTDAGLTWNLLSKSPSVGNMIQKIQVSPANSNIVFAAGSGMWRSNDGGSTWVRATAAGNSIAVARGVEPFVMDPTNPAILYVHTGSALMKTTDGGDTWNKVTTKGLPIASGGYTALAMTPANNQYLYAAIAVGSGRRSGVVGAIGYSSDGGANWTISLDSASCPDDFVTQGDYCVALAVDPHNTNNVTFGGLNVYNSPSYGASPVIVGNSGSSSSAGDFVHADIRRLLYIGDSLFVLTDGGIYHNESFGSVASWGKGMNSTLNTFQQIGGDVFVQNGRPKFFIAGAQDNGTTKWSDGKSWGPIIHGGDGGRCFVEQSQGRQIYATYPEYRNHIEALYRSDDEGQTFSQNLLPTSDIWGTGAAGTGDLYGGYPQYDVCQSKFSNAVFCGAKYGWITTDGFNTLTQMTPVKSGTANVSPSYIHISKANPSTIYYGGGQKCYWSTDAGQTWNAPTSIMKPDGTGGGTSFNGKPTWITTDPRDETNVFLTTDNTSGKPLYASTDGGVTWWQPTQKLDGGQQPLPSFTYRTMAVDSVGKFGPVYIFLGGDGGVLAFDYKDSSWVALSNGIPPGTVITGLQVRAGWLIATTYGRGMYYIKTHDIFAKADVAQNEQPTTVSIQSVYPNPVSTSGATSTIRYSMENSSVAQIAIFDNLGRQERLLANEWTAKGDHEKTLDLSGLPAGTHYLLLTADGVSISKPVTIQ